MVQKDGNNGQKKIKPGNEVQKWNRWGISAKRRFARNNKTLLWKYVFRKNKDEIVMESASLGPSGWMFQSWGALEVCFAVLAALFLKLYICTLMLFILFPGTKKTTKKTPRLRNPVMHKLQRWHIISMPPHTCNRQSYFFFKRKMLLWTLYTFNWKAPVSSRKPFRSLIGHRCQTRSFLFVLQLVPPFFYVHWKPSCVTFQVHQSNVKH